MTLNILDEQVAYEMVRTLFLEFSVSECKAVEKELISGVEGNDEDFLKQAVSICAKVCKIRDGREKRGLPRIDSQLKPLDFPAAERARVRFVRRLEEAIYCLSPKPNEYTCRVSG